MENKQLNHSEFNKKDIKYPITLLVDNLEDPRNIGSIFRISDALGVNKIYLTGTSPTPPNSKIRKTSRSTEKYITFKYFKKAEEVIEKLQTKNTLIIALEITSKSKDIKNFRCSPNANLCLIIGSENKGISEKLLNLADDCIYVPMLGNNSSMNVANVTAIAVYELSKILKKINK